LAGAVAATFVVTAALTFVLTRYVLPAPAPARAETQTLEDLGRQLRGDVDTSAASKGNAVDAGRPDVPFGDLAITLTSVRVGPAERLWPQKHDPVTKDNYLQIALTLRNTSKTRKINYLGGGVLRGGILGRGEASAVLDDRKNTYKEVLVPYFVQGQAGAKALYPNDSLSDLLIFERPVDGFGYLLLQLPGSNFGTEGVLVLRIRKDMVQ
jgi:hypothetical protein